MPELNDEEKKLLREYMSGYLDAVFAAFEGRPIVRPAQERTDEYEHGLTRGESSYADAEEKEAAHILGILDQETLHELQVVYYGCIGDSGHYFWEREGYSSSRRDPLEAAIERVWTDVDGVLCYGIQRYSNGPQEEGLALLHHKGGWTALSFWDRSVDHRGGSNSNFFAHGIFTFDQVCQIAEARFPRVWKRYKFKVRLLETLEED